MILDLDSFNKYSQENKCNPLVAEDYVCTVKWFCRKKGYGFALLGHYIEEGATYFDATTNSEVRSPEDFFRAMKRKEVICDSEAIKGEIFMHLSRINQGDKFLDINIKPEDIVVCNLINSPRGLQIREIKFLFSKQKSPDNLIECEGTIKWFNEKEGFGFVKPDLADFEQDVFLSGKKIKELGISPTDLTPKRKVKCSFSVENGKAIVAQLALI